METHDKELTPAESLELIRGMINKTKHVVADDSFYFLLWGWMVFVCCLGQFALKVYFDYPKHYQVWLLMPVAGLISAVYGSRQAKRTPVKTFVGDSLDHLWLALGLAFLVLITINILSGTAWQTAFTYYILLYAIGTFVSGRLLRFRPLLLGGLFNFVLAAASVKFSFDYQLLIGALAILTSYIIPGHLLRIRYQNQKD